MCLHTDSQCICVQQSFGAPGSAGEITNKAAEVEAKKQAAAKRKSKGSKKSRAAGSRKGKNMAAATARLDEALPELLQLPASAANTRPAGAALDSGTAIAMQPPVAQAPDPSAQATAVNASSAHSWPDAGMPAHTADPVGFANIGRSEAAAASAQPAAGGTVYGMADSAGAQQQPRLPLVGHNVPMQADAPAAQHAPEMSYPGAASTATNLPLNEPTLEEQRILQLQQQLQAALSARGISLLTAPATQTAGATGGFFAPTPTLGLQSAMPQHHGTSWQCGVQGAAGAPLAEDNSFVDPRVLVPQQPSAGPEEGAQDTASGSQYSPESDEENAAPQACPLHV